MSSGVQEVKPWRRPYGYWRSREHRRRFMQHVMSVLSIHQPEDWASVTVRDVSELGGRGFLHHYRDSLQAAIEELVPEHAGAKCRRKMSNGHWKQPSVLAAAVKDLERILGIRSMEEWKGVRGEDVRSAGYGSLLKYYKGSVWQILQAAYPEKGITPSDCRKVAPRGHWEVRENRLAVLQRVEKAFAVADITDWKRISAADVRLVEGGTGLLQHYNGSLLRALTDLRSQDFEHAFLEAWGAKGTHVDQSYAPKMLAFLSRPQVPIEWWQEDDFVTAYVLHAAEQLGVKKPSDWYRVSQRQIRGLAGGHTFLRQRELLPALRLAYPGQEWDEGRLKQLTKKSTQWFVLQCTERLFPLADVEEEYRHEDMTGLEFDVYVPGHKLALEYQGRQHYEEVGVLGPLQAIQERDGRKAERARQLGIRLIEVPYWWDNEIDSLAAMLHEAYPTLLPASLDQATRLLPACQDAEAADVAASAIEHLTYLLKRLNSSSPPRAVPPMPRTDLLTTAQEADPTGLLMAPIGSMIGVSLTAEGDVATTRSMRNLAIPKAWKEQLPLGISLDGSLSMGRDGYGELLRLLLFQPFQYTKASAGHAVPPLGPSFLDHWGQR